MKNWYEIWADNGLEIPYILCVKYSSINKNIQIIDIKESKTLIEDNNYDVIKNWLQEDEYEKISDRIHQDQDEIKNWAVSGILKTDNDSESLYQENIFLVKAPTEIKALEIAKNELLNLETSYKNNNQEIINWSFHSIMDVQEVLDDIKFDCACIYSKHFTESEINIIKSKIGNKEKNRF